MQYATVKLTTRCGLRSSARGAKQPRKSRREIERVRCLILMRLLIQKPRTRLSQSAVFVGERGFPGDILYTRARAIQHGRVLAGLDFDLD